MVNLKCKKYKGNRVKALQRDNFECKLCGENNYKKLCVHHIDGNGKKKNGKALKVKEQNNNLDNLMTLCFRCHNVLHFSQRPKVWSYKYRECIKCGTDKVMHRGKGLCQKCYSKQHRLDNIERERTRQAKYYKERGKYLLKLNIIKKARS